MSLGISASDVGTRTLLRKDPDTRAPPPTESRDVTSLPREVGVRVCTVSGLPVRRPLTPRRRGKCHSHVDHIVYPPSPLPSRRDPSRPSPEPPGGSRTSSPTTCSRPTSFGCGCSLGARFGPCAFSRLGGRRLRIPNAVDGEKVGSPSEGRETSPL